MVLCSENSSALMAISSLVAKGALLASNPSGKAEKINRAVSQCRVLVIGL